MQSDALCLLDRRHRLNLKIQINDEVLTSMMRYLSNHFDPNVSKRGSSLVKIAISTIVIMFILLSSPGFAKVNSKSRLDGILLRGVLKVGTTGDYSPYSFKDLKTGEFKGFDIDLAYDLARALGVRVQFIETSWPTLSEDLENDRFDMVMGGITVTLERQKNGIFSKPYLNDGKSPISRCSESNRYVTIEDIDRAEVRVIVNPGGTNEKFVLAHLKHAQIIVWNDNTTIFDQIVERKADVMITDASETRYQQRLHPSLLCAVNPNHPFNNIEKAYWIQRAPYLAAFVDQWLHQAKRNGTFNALYRTWFR